MAKLYSVPVKTDHGQKEIAVFQDDVTLFGEGIDILTTSAYINSYSPIYGTVFRALDDCGISVRSLAKDPEIDLRKPCRVWLSAQTDPHTTNIHRIGCVEFGGYHPSWDHTESAEQTMLTSFRAYFSMLDIAALYDIPMATVALPLLASGSQNLDPKLVLIPLINECIAFMKRNDRVKRIYFIERNPEKANLIAEHLKESYRFVDTGSTPAPVTKPRRQKYAFISYASEDKNIADNLCSKLEQNGIRVWYAPRDVFGPYAASIVQAIDVATHFIVILSQNSIASPHVLSEIDLAFQNLPDNICFAPLRIDDTVFTPSFKYYLSRQHWMDATIPPLEIRLNEFVQKLLKAEE